MNTLAYVYLYVQNMLAKDEEGQGMAEYGLILVLVSIAAIVALGALGDQLGVIFDEITAALTP